MKLSTIVKSILSESKIQDGKFKHFYIELEVDKNGKEIESFLKTDDPDYAYFLLVTDTNFHKEKLDKNDIYKVSTDDLLDDVDPEDRDPFYGDYQNAVADIISKETGAKYHKKYKDLEKAIQ